MFSAEQNEPTWFGLLKKKRKKGGSLIASGVIRCPCDTSIWGSGVNLSCVLCVGGQALASANALAVCGPVLRLCALCTGATHAWSGSASPQPTFTSPLLPGISTTAARGRACEDLVGKKRLLI